MTLVFDMGHRSHSSQQLTSTHGCALEDRFEVLKDIGDGSFGSVVLARVRGAGANVAKRGTIVSMAGQYAGRCLC
jgi:meiosis induction protein kinase IME2/SME1